MKIVYTADTHFGSSFNGEDKNSKNGELFSVFREMIDYAKSIDAKMIILGGDIFDSPYPDEETKATFKSIITHNSDLQFIAIAGNHDPLYTTAFWNDVPDNLYVFPEKITAYDSGDITIYGVSDKSGDYTKDFWQGFKADGKFITLHHGDIYPASLSDTGAALCLMGHIHKNQVINLDSGAKAIYCGCPAARGFDECGDKGFYVIDTQDFSFEFIKTNAKIYKEYETDISNAQSIGDVIELLQEVKVGDNEIARAVLVGSIKTPFTIDTDKLCSLTEQFVQIKDRSEIDIDVMESINQNTLEGEFIRILSAKLEKAEGDERQKILDAMKEGIVALRGK